MKAFSFINCVIIEDNELDRDIAEDFISQIPFINHIGSFSSPFDAIGTLKNGNVQLLLLDLDIPVINGFDFYNSLSMKPLCVIITAHPEYALEGFEANVLDYIVKPLKLERLQKAVSLAKEYLEIKEKAALFDVSFENNILSIKEGTTIIQLRTKDIIYLEALGDYTKIITNEKVYMTLLGLKLFIERLPENRFLRIHRSFAVSVDKIRKLKDNELILDEIHLPVGKTFRRDVNKYLIQN